MSDSKLSQLADAAGLSVDWVDADGQPQQVKPDTLRALLEALGYPAQGSPQISESLARIEQENSRATLEPLITATQGRAVSFGNHFKARTPAVLLCENGERIEVRLDHHARLPPINVCGYHQLFIDDEQLTLAVAPRTCPSVRELTGQQRIWGLSAQLYSLRREHDGGVGDTHALELLARSAATKGADALAVSPTHAMFSADSRIYSPYSPSSRLQFNILHAAPAHILGEAAMARAIKSCGLEQEFERLEELSLIDWPAVARVRQQILRALHADFAHANDERRQDFQRFLERGDSGLIHHCRFEALHHHMLKRERAGDWRDWPPEYRDPHHAAVQQFATEHSGEIEFHAFCQWLIDRCLARTQDAARDAGMKIGLIADLAVGAECTGSQIWARQSEFLSSLGVGAPPDLINRAGQNWGLSAFSPSGLKQHGYRAFIEMLRANLAHAGGLRIDHVMGLKRLWLIPKDHPPDQGAYLHYPFEDLLRLLCLESSRSRALVIGEDLGTVAEGLRETLARHHILGMRVLLFEQSEGQFIAPEKWPDNALATTTTHDLPSVRGWLSGRDIHWRLASEHISDEQAKADWRIRQDEKAALCEALRASDQYRETDDDAEAQLQACIGYVASTPAPLVLLPLEDAMGDEEQPNLPGNGSHHPNWRRRWPVTAERMLDLPAVEKRLQRLIQTQRGAADG